MKTSNIEVKDMLSVLSVAGVEERIGEVSGVESVTVNFAAGHATVRYDETRLNVADIRSAVRQGEYGPAAGPYGGEHDGHVVPPETSAPSAPKSTPNAAAAAPPATDKPSPAPFKAPAET
jgi:copper chaperone CopZ